MGQRGRFLGQLGVRNKLLLIVMISLLVLVGYSAPSGSAAVEQSRAARDGLIRVELAKVQMGLAQTLVGEQGWYSSLAELDHADDLVEGASLSLGSGFDVRTDDGIAELERQVNNSPRAEAFFRSCLPAIRDVQFRDSTAFFGVLRPTLARLRMDRDAATIVDEYDDLRKHAVTVAECLLHGLDSDVSRSLLALSKAHLSLSQELSAIGAFMAQRVTGSEVELPGELAVLEAEQRVYLRLAAQEDTTIKSVWADFSEDFDFGDIRGYESIAATRRDLQEIKSRTTSVEEVLTFTTHAQETGNTYTEVETFLSDRLTAEAKAKQDSTRWTMIRVMASTVVVTVVTLGFTLAVAQSILRPLDLLTAQASGLRSGDVQPGPLNIGGSDELTVLGEAFDAVVEHLELVEVQLTAAAVGDELPGSIVNLQGRLGESVQRSVERLAETTGQLRRSEALSRSVIESAPDAIVIADSAQYVTSANGSALSLFGMTERQLVGRRLDELVVYTPVDGEDEYEAWAIRASLDRVPVFVSMASADVDGTTIRTAMFRDMTAHRDAQRRLAYEATHDALTGLLNRAGLMDRIEENLRASTPILLFVDLDRFKHVNDTMGHAVGDELLVAAAERISSVLREGDDVGRVGGDEFVLLLDNLDEQSAVQLGERLVTALSLPFILDTAGNVPVFVSGSVGVAQAHAGDSADELLVRADLAMYEAKRSRSSRVTLFDEGIIESIAETSRIEVALRHALGEGRIEIHFQPIVELATGIVRGYEALSRWVDADGTSISPAQFVPIAETSGLINELWHLVLERSCVALARWQQEHPGLTVSVNVSGRQLGSAEIVEQIAAAIHRFGINAKGLALEVTETSLVEDPDDAAVLLEELQALGVAVHLDDFGTGFSSLTHLHRFAVDAVKIDRSFTVRMLDDHSVREIISAVISLAQGMSFDGIAEGIETAEQRLMLVEMECPLGQGYLFSAASPVAAADPTYRFGPCITGEQVQSS